MGKGEGARWPGALCANCARKANAAAWAAGLIAADTLAREGNGKREPLTTC